MIQISFYQIAQIVMITTAFILHLLTFYDLSYRWAGNMVMFEATVYGTYFLIKLGYLVAVLTDGAFSPPLEAMTKLNGAVLFNILGLISIITYSEVILQSGIETNAIILSLVKGLTALIISLLYYIEVFQA